MPPEVMARSSVPKKIAKDLLAKSTDRWLFFFLPAGTISELKINEDPVHSESTQH